MVKELAEKVVTEGFGPLLTNQGFKMLRSLEFKRKHGRCQKELSVFFVGRAADAINIQPFCGFVYNEIEDLTAQLKGEPRRKGWPTASGNIGQLSPLETYLEWPVTKATKVDELGATISEYILDYAVPFWDDFDSIEKLYQGFKVVDYRLKSMRGDRVWGFAAASCLLGLIEEAKQIVSQAPLMSPDLIEAGIQRIDEWAA